MAKGGEVRLQLDHVRVQVAKASDDYLEAIALQIEAQTKVNIQKNSQIDTGFMMNSVYTVSKKLSTYGTANKDGDYQSTKTGQTVRRKIAPQVTLSGNARAAAVVGADYAIFQEAKKPFLNPAAETVANQTKGTAEKVFKEDLND